MNTKLLLSKQKIHNNEFMNILLLTLNYFYKSSSDTVFFDKRSIFYLLTGKTPNVRECKKDRTILKNIQIGLDLLFENGDLHLFYKDHDFYEISSKELYINTHHYFVQVQLSDLRKIFNQCSKPFAVSSFYIQLLSNINSKTHVFCMSQHDMAAFFQLNQNTLCGYLHKLQELMLIYRYIPQKYIIADKTLKNAITFYGVYQYKEQIKMESEKYISKMNTYPKYNGLNRRSIKLRYLAFVNGAKKYINDPSLIPELYNDCIQYNHSYQHDDQHLYDEEKQLNLEPFEKYMLNKV